MLLTAAFLAYKRSQSDLNSRHSNRSIGRNHPNSNHNTSDNKDNGNNNDTIDVIRSVHKATIGRCFAPDTATTTTAPCNSSNSFDNSSSSEKKNISKERGGKSRKGEASER